MSVIDKEEKKRLSIMYEGDKPRDASDKVRGFLFQDYVAISCLLQEHVDYVCLEYLEDVDVFFDDNRFEFIQVKYYPGTSPVMSDILTDLYYQFLRLRMLDSHLNPIPRLYIHREQEFEDITVEDMKWYMGYVNKSPKGKNQTTPPPNGTLKATSIYPADPADWLRKHIYPLNKEPQKQKLFEKMAAVDSLRDFVDSFAVKKQKNIMMYRQDLMETLSKIYPNRDSRRDEQQWQQILLGLAITHIQLRYTLNKSESVWLREAFFDKLRVSRTEFNNYINEAVSTKPERKIAGYLAGIATAEFEQISRWNPLNDLQLDMLNRIYRKTIIWLSEISASVDGQYRLLNTISTDEAAVIANFKNQDEEKKFISIAECKRDYCRFLRYLWKIILNICQETLDDQKMLDQYPSLFDPKTYIDEDIKDYVCLNFPQDPYIDRSVILPAAVAEFRGTTRKITERMVNMPNKPGKWFFQNYDLKTGKNYYSYNTANISENPTVADLGEDTFYVECMNCIHIDEGDWSEHENCSDCIFSLKCVKERSE